MNPSSYSGFTWPVVVVLVTSVYGYWATQRELVSSRPAVKSLHEIPRPVPTPGMNTFHSRLWEDPLASSFVDWQNLPPIERASSLDVVLDPVSAAEESNPTTPSASAQTSSKSNSENDPIDKVKNEKEKARYQERMGQARQLLKSLVTKDEWNTVCLTVFVPGSPYPEDKEARVRSRYAVETALAEGEYHLKFDKQTNYVVPRIFVRTFRGWQEEEIVIPIKLYRNEAEKKQVLLFWINESQLGLRPLLALHRIMNTLLGEAEVSEEKVSLSIIGPSSSGVLDDIRTEIQNLHKARSKEAPATESNDSANELAHWSLATPRPKYKMQGYSPLFDLENRWGKGVNIYSSRATIDFREVTEEELKQDPDKEFENALFTTNFVKLRRTIGTDHQLAELIVKELKLRNALDGRVVLITEHDTNYGRAIPEAFKKVVIDKDKLEVVKFLRGIDGKLMGEDNPSKNQTRTVQPGSQKPTAELPVVVDRQPAGESQYDYLRRLNRTLEKMGDVKAIGVVGSDVYDKLLVLRALKPQFPDCVFFTTDLESIYCHPDEIKHTRNLLIASHFGLSLETPFQKETPPFRDNYQTAMFLATRLALPPADVEKNANLSGEQKQRARNQAATLEAFAKQPAFHPAMYVVGRNDIHLLPGHGYASAVAQVTTQSDGETPAARPAKAATPDANAAEVDAKTQPSEDASRLPLQDFFHPDLTHDPGAWHYFFVVALALLAGGGSWVAMHRSRFWEFFKKLKQEPLALFLLLSGLVMLVTFVLRAYFGAESGSMFHGISTWPTKTIYSLIGMMAVFSNFYLLHRFSEKILHLRDDPELEEHGRIAREHFGIAQTAKCLIFGLVVAYVGGLMSCKLDDPKFWVPSVGLALALGVCWRYSNRNLRDDFKDPLKKLVLGKSAPYVLRFALGLMLGVTLLFGTVKFMSSSALPESASKEAGFVSHNPWDISENDRHIGWYPAYNSRGALSQLGDWLATGYAFGTVCMLLSTFVFLQVWCWEFFEYDERGNKAEWRKKQADENGTGTNDAEEEVADWIDKYRLFRAMGVLTSMPGVMAPVLMTLIFMLVVAYHPYLAPTSIPISLLVVTSLAVLVFLFSSLVLRWRLNKEKELALSRIDGLIELLSDNRSEKQPEPTEAEVSERRGLVFQEQMAELTELVSNYGNGDRELSLLVASSYMSRNSSPSQPSKPNALEKLKKCKQQMEALSEGVFQSWNKTPLSWILGGGTAIALVDTWIRWWTFSV